MREREELERADPVLSFIFIFSKKRFTCITRDNQQLRSKSKRETFNSYLNDEVPETVVLLQRMYTVTFGPCRESLWPRSQAPRDATVRY